MRVLLLLLGAGFLFVTNPTKDEHLQALGEDLGQQLGTAIGMDESSRELGLTGGFLMQFAEEYVVYDNLFVFSVTRIDDEAADVLGLNRGQLLTIGGAGSVLPPSEIEMLANRIANNARELADRLEEYEENIER